MCGYAGHRESGLCVFREFCLVCFRVVGESPSFCCNLYSCRMFIVVMMGKWSDDIAFCVLNDVRLYNVLDTVVISGEDVSCSVVCPWLVLHGLSC